MDVRVLCFSLIFYIHLIHGSPLVRVEEGEISGTTYVLPNGRVVNAFFGVPYAASPVGKRRFKEPIAHKPWAGTWNASVLSSICYQYTHATYTINGEEDCLYLNIYTPQLPENGVSPLMNVLVYIHGGAFMFGTGNTITPDYLLQSSDVVFVSLNYRLGVLGFFSSGDTSVPGNNGLKDQVAALRWVHHNIIKFGGNPASVTIAGSSAGGASVHYHYLSPTTDGLFQKGISLSGSVLPQWTLPLNVTEKSLRLAVIVGCPTSTTREMVKCLQKRPARQIVEATKNFLEWKYCPFTAFGPVVEPPNPVAFLTSKPIDLLRNGEVKQLQWLTSFNKDEGLYPAAEHIADETLLAELNAKAYEIFPNLLFYNFSVKCSEKNAVTDAIKNFYFGDEPISRSTAKQLVQMLGDRAFYNDMTEAIKLHAKVSRQNVYCYMFNYRGKYSLSNKYSKTLDDYGVSHGDDLHYVVNYFGLSAYETDSDRKMTQLMSSIFVDFMNTGIANVTGIEWKPILKDSELSCLNINSATDYIMADLVNEKTVAFWKKVLPFEYPEVAIKDEL